MFVHGRETVSAQCLLSDARTKLVGNENSALKIASSKAARSAEAYSCQYIRVDSG